MIYQPYFQNKRALFSKTHKREPQGIDDAFLNYLALFSALFLTIFLYVIIQGSG